MTSEQVSLILLFALLLGFFAWGRYRHDVVAFGGLMLAVAAGLVPAEHAFDGLAHTATVTVAAMLVLTRALVTSGATSALGDWVSGHARTITSHIGTLAFLTAGLSTVMNNVGALAITLPVAMRTAAKAERSPSLLLMPISFAALLGGLVTLIGTPPNIIAAAFRQEALGEPYHLLDFSWVGLPLALTGITFLVFVGWRFLPRKGRRAAGTDDFLDIGDYVTEIRLDARNKLIGQTVGDVSDQFAELDTAILGLLREDRRVPNVPRRFLMRPDDILIIEVSPTNLPRLLERFGLEIVVHEAPAMSLLSNEDVRIAEVVIKPGSELEGRNDTRDRLAHQMNVNLLAVARQGARVRDRLDRVIVRAGDVLLLQGEEQRLAEVVRLLGLLPLAERELDVAKPKKALRTIAIFAAAILSSAVGLLPLPIALGSAVVAMVLAGVLPTRELYESIEWPVILLLASMIPIGEALQTTGVAALLAEAVVDVSSEHGPVVTLIVLFIATMLLTDVINNAATVVVMAPISIAVANGLDANVDTFLMGVAIAASCAFLTPIGHQNNTIVMGPGGYAFTDYFRMGLPLQIVLVTIGIPLLLAMWPIDG